MKKERTYQNYVNYFVKWDGMGALGGGMMVVGIMCLWLGWSFVSYILSIVGMFGGIAVFLYGSIGRAGDADLQNEIRHRAEGMSFRELEEDPRFRRRVPKGNIEERVFEGYDMREGLYFKKRKDGSICSSEYTHTKMLTLLDSFYIKSLTFSFTEDKKQTVIEELLFDDLTDITVERERMTLVSANGKPFAVKTCFLYLYASDGRRVALHIGDDIFSDEFAESMKRKYITERGA